jgi:hypothetical protein
MSRIDFVGLARQDGGRGDKQTTMEYFVPVESANVTLNRETLEIQETTGTRFPIGIDYGTRYFEVPLAGAPRPASLPRILSAFLGQADSAAAGGHHAHTFDPTAAGKNPEWHSIFVARNDPSPAIVDLFYDCKGNELQLNIAPNDYLRIDATFYALHVDDTTPAPTPTTDMTKKTKFSEAIIEISEDDGATFGPVVSAGWGFTYNNNIDTDEAVLGSRELFNCPDGNADLEVRFSPRENMLDYYRQNLLADPTQIAVRMTATHASGAKIVATAHNCEITDAPAAVSGADILKMIEVTARGSLSPAGKFLTVVVTNDVATYA